MIDRKILMAIQTVLALVFVLLINGCSNIKIPVEVVGDFHNPQKLDLSVDLHLSDELSDYRWKQETAFGGGFKMELGPDLCLNAEAMAKSVFKHVTISRGPIDTNTTGQAAVLIPRVVSVEKPIGSTSFSKTEMVVDLEWSLVDKTGKLIWVETIQGIGEGKTGNSFNHKSHTRKMVKNAFLDLFQKSAKAMLESPEILAFVEANNAKHL